MYDQYRPCGVTAIDSLRVSSVPVQHVTVTSSETLNTSVEVILPSAQPTRAGWYIGPPPVGVHIITEDGDGQCGVVVRYGPEELIVSVRNTAVESDLFRGTHVGWRA